ncbi:MAG TPA: SRPBCC family protein [Bacteroidota bacterium]|nr:SRPBCC family protein [Bacteroidota bacterium]
MKTKGSTLFEAEPGKQEVRITREFDAPRELLFRALTEGKYYEQWIGPRRLQTKIEILDARSGGRYRYVQDDGAGHQHAFHGVYHEVTFPERIIDTFEYEGLPEKGHVFLETTKLEELPEGRCRLVTQAVYQSVSDRDGMVHAGMEHGVIESHARLAELLEKLQSAGT